MGNFIQVKRGATFLGMASLGAALMFLLDPDAGRRRRALLRDKLVSKTKDTAKFVRRQGTRVRERMQGAALEKYAAAQHQQVPDDVLVSRVRSELGHAISNVGLLQITAQNGKVSISGSVHPGELVRLEERLEQLSGLHSWMLNLSET
jgi:hypothetical protein